MSGRKERTILIVSVLSVSLIVSALTAALILGYCGRLQFDMLETVCGQIVERNPDVREDVLEALKVSIAGADGNALREQHLLDTAGYDASDLLSPAYRWGLLAAIVAFLTGAILFLFSLWYRNRTERVRILALADYLERINLGEAAVLTPHREDDFSRLEDEIYKTVTSLHQTRDAAVQARDHFAENLSNIAHQIKTPITALSLSLQALDGTDLPQGAAQTGRQVKSQMRRQLERLTRLEEALLLLSRLDAGTLTFQREKTDVYTLLVLAAENLQELLHASGTVVDIPEQREMAITADLDWTMEAVMNLMKNCMEHAPGGIIHCSYEQNPLYTEIRIRDEGPGFDREDIPHLFRRFYRGKHASEGGIGIGLALAKEIIEGHNGTIRAKNMPEGGACFEIRLYASAEKEGEVSATEGAVTEL